MTTPTNTDDVIDSRDVIARIEELEEECEAYNDDSDNEIPWGQQCPEDFAELKALQVLAEQAEGYCSDWRYGAPLIRDSYFQTYAREYAEDVCELPTSWPTNCIDWEQAARELRMDYTGVEFDGVIYWVR